MKGRGSKRFFLKNRSKNRLESASLLQLCLYNLDPIDSFSLLPTRALRHKLMNISLTGTATRRQARPMRPSSARPPPIPAQNLLLLRLDALSALNAVRQLARAGWRSLLVFGLPLIVILFYAPLLIMAEIHTAARLVPDNGLPLLALALALSLLGGIRTGIASTRRRWRMIRTPWLLILPLTDTEITRTTRLATTVDCALATAFIALAISSIPITSQAMPRSAIIAGLTATYALGCAIGTRTRATRNHPLRSSILPYKPPRDIPPAFEKIDRRRPAGLGAWAIGPRLRSLLTTSTILLISNIGIASAAAHEGAAAIVTPPLAIVTPVILLILALNAAPMLSPVLRTSPLQFRNASIGLLRLPGLIASLWLALFEALAFACRWMSSAQIAFTIVTASGLAMLYAITALSLPQSSRLAAAAYTIALLLVGDQYASLQNFGFLVMFIVTFALLLRARSAYRHGD